VFLFIALLRILFQIVHYFYLQQAISVLQVIGRVTFLILFLPIADKYTIFTDFGYSHHSFGLKKFSETWNYEKKYITSGENKVKLN